VVLQEVLLPVSQVLVVLQALAHPVELMISIDITEINL